MYIENWDKIYGRVLYTLKTKYEITKDDMKVAYNAYTIRLRPIMYGTLNPKSFTIIVTILDNSIRCGIYLDGEWQPVEIFDMSRMDLKTIDRFERLLSQKIQNHE